MKSQVRNHEIHKVAGSSFSIKSNHGCIGIKNNKKMLFFKNVNKICVFLYLVVFFSQYCNIIAHQI